jgi:hypothetical protein
MRGKSTVTDSKRWKAAKKLFLRSSGFLRMAELLRAGVHRDTLYELRDAGIIETVSRGLYRLADAPSLGNPDLAAVALRVPKGVVCLISAIAFLALRLEWPRIPPGHLWPGLARTVGRLRVPIPDLSATGVSRRIANSAGPESSEFDRECVNSLSTSQTSPGCPGP